MKLCRRLMALAFVGAWWVAAVLGVPAGAQEGPPTCTTPVPVTVPGTPLACPTSTTTTEPPPTTTTSTSTTIPEEEEEEEEEEPVVPPSTTGTSFDYFGTDVLPEINLGGDPTAPDPSDVGAVDEGLGGEETFQPIAARDSGFRYPVVFMLPLVMLVVAGYLGYGLTQPITVPSR